MEMPVVLKQSLEELNAKSSQDNIKKSATKISLRYRTEIKKGQELIDGHADSVAYALSRMPATFGAISTVMAQAAEIPDFNPVSFTDVGSGTGSAVWSAACFFNLNKIVCLERNANMLKTGKELTEKGKDFFSTIPEWKKFDLLHDSLPCADLVCAAYVLNELEEGKRSDALLKLWNASENSLVLIEPATPENFKQMKKHRQTLIDAGAFITAPCPHQNECENDWCHFGCRVARTKIHRLAKGGEAPYEDEKFCYLIACRQKHPSNAFRVLRHPLIEKGKVTLSLCSAEGIIEKTLSKKDGAAYKAARKIKWGNPFIPTE